MGEADDKTIKDCNDKVMEYKNNTSNYNRDISLALNYDKNAMTHSNTNYLKAT